jgi:predicted nucleic acid-binding protein
MAADALVMGGPLLLDTCVLIDVLQGRTPTVVDELLERRVLHHSTVVLSEITHAFGRLDPNDPRTKGALSQIAATIEEIPAHRLTSPSAQAHGEAGVLAGLVMRLFEDGRQEPKEIINDALIFLHAQEQGASVLTRNMKDFGKFLALMPKGRVLFYVT